MVRIQYLAFLAASRVISLGRIIGEKSTGGDRHACRYSATHCRYGGLASRCASAEKAGRCQKYAASWHFQSWRHAFYCGGGRLLYLADHSRQHALTGEMKNLCRGHQQDNGGLKEGGRISNNKLSMTKRK